MKNILFSLLLVFMCASTFARQIGNGERIKELRKQFIEEQLNLKGNKANEFWKVHNKFDSERRSVKKEMKDLQRGFNAMSDEQLKGALDKMFVLKEKENDIDKKYFQEFQKVLTIRQIAVLYQSDQKFKREILNKLRERIGGGVIDDIEED